MDVRVAAVWQLPSPSQAQDSPLSPLERLRHRGEARRQTPWIGLALSCAGGAVAARMPASAAAAGDLPTGCRADAANQGLEWQGELQVADEARLADAADAHGVASGVPAASGGKQRLRRRAASARPRPNRLPPSRGSVSRRRSRHCASCSRSSMPSAASSRFAVPRRASSARGTARILEVREGRGGAQLRLCYLAFQEDDGSSGRTGLTMSTCARCLRTATTPSSWDCERGAT